MKKVYYMKARKMTDEDRKKVNISKIGGLPTYLPENYPCYPSGEQEAFLMQLYCDPNMFLEVENIENIRCWQMYQPKSGGVIENILTLPLSAEINKGQLGTCVDYLDEYIIEFEEGEEPDIWDIDDLNLYESKIGGAVPEQYIGSEDTYIGTIFEDLCDLIFGIEAIELYLDKDGNMRYTVY